MERDPIVEEVRRAREQLLELAGGHVSCVLSAALNPGASGE